MMVVRPIAADDLGALLQLAGKAGTGLTTLPDNAEQLNKRIKASLASFAGNAAPADEMFVLVLEETEDPGGSGRMVGICAIAAAVGLRQPWYSYRVGQVVHASQELGIFTQTATLFLSNDHTGQSELCSLFLDPAYRIGKNGSLLSKCRFLFLAQFRERFSKKIIAEMRGVSDAAGRSPFWDSLGRHFFSMEFGQADYLTGIGKKSFVAELMPRHPLYSSFLTAEAQAVIGKTHELTRPALAMLESEGFRYEGHVDIFDAGPAVECDIDDIGAVAASRIYQVAVEREPTGRAVDAPAVHYLLSNIRLGGFRAMVVRGTPAGNTFRLTAAEAAALGVDDGDSVRAVPLSPRDRIDHRPH
jgi:arginine N-succinyltransferase